MSYIKDKEGIGFSGVSNTQYPRYLCLDYCGWGDSPRNMWRWQENRLDEKPSVLDEGCETEKKLMLDKAFEKVFKHHGSGVTEKEGKG